jgi:tetratricopeptide (TPR) repeat protein
VLALIYRLLERAESDTVFADLEILLDQVTPYYKARVEEYQTKLQRAVIDAIALNWDPITSRAICEATATEATTISPQLIRLRNDGLIEEVPTSGSRSGYQLVERFFNIWYLMRHGTRRTRQKLSWLAKFLASFYRPDELRLIAAEAAIESSAKRWHPMYREALAEAIDSISGAARFGFKGVEEAISPEDLSFMTEIELRRAIEADPANLSAREELAFRLAVQLNRPEEAIAILDEIVARYGDAAEPPLREHVARALFNKGFTLGSLGRSEEAIAVYNALEARYGDAAELPLRVRVARALVNKGITLGSLGRSEEAIAVYDGLEARYGDAAELPLRVRVARALFSKGLTFASLGRSEEAIAVYDGLVTRFGKLAEPPIREIVEKALLQKGNIFADLLDRPGDAEVAYQDAMRISGDRSMSAKASLAWLCLTTQRLSEAEAFRARLETLPPNTLLDAGLEIGRDNFGAAAQILGSALAQSPDSGFDFSGDLPRLLRLIEARGYGEWLIGWFGETGHAERLAPVYAAFVAYVRGERFLLDVNPEVRAPARDIFDRLSAARRHQAAKKPIAGDKRRRGRPAKRR